MLQLLYRDARINCDTATLGIEFEKRCHIADPTDQKQGRSPPNNLPPITSGGIEVLYKWEHISDPGWVV